MGDVFWSYTIQAARKRTNTASFFLLPKNASLVTQRLFTNETFNDPGAILFSVIDKKPDKGGILSSYPPLSISSRERHSRASQCEIEASGLQSQLHRAADYDRLV
jgi:hypothetical protein